MRCTKHPCRNFASSLSSLYYLGKFIYYCVGSPVVFKVHFKKCSDLIISSYWLRLTLYFAMSEKGQTHFKNLAVNAARF